jgi:hypothetical protein
LNIRVASIIPCGINPVFITHNLPKLATNLVTTLTSLDMKDFSHLDWLVLIKKNENVKRRNIERGLEGRE